MCSRPTPRWNCTVCTMMHTLRDYGAFAQNFRAQVGEVTSVVAPSVTAGKGVQLARNLLLNSPAKVVSA